MPKPPTHGGRRDGAGRPPNHPEGPTRKIVAFVPELLVEKIERLADRRGVSRSDAITEAIRKAVRRS